MTIVELFDGVSICNMASCLVMKPEKVVFIGESEPMNELREAYIKVAENHGIKVSLEYMPIKKTALRILFPSLLK